MGQKTHPIGFRLTVNKEWRSNWFASKKHFKDELAEDVQIRKYLKQRLPNAGVSKVEIRRTSKVVTITIHTARPGIVIGKGGEEVKRLRKEVKQLTNDCNWLKPIAFLLFHFALKVLLLVQVRT